jgi:sialic acid synthase SpsE
MLPAEFAEMKERIIIVEKSLGDGIKQPSANEVASIIRFRKTMYTKHAIKKGSVINVGDIIYTAPAYGIYSKYEDIVIGQIATQDIAENMPITWDMLGGPPGGL